MTDWIPFFIQLCVLIAIVMAAFKVVAALFGLVGL
jgi:hypothetical protein